jgi:two-component system response regulator HydG
VGHVLVVDDLRNVRATLALQLREAGHQVVEAVGGKIALELIERSVFDLVLTDLRMDEVDGLEVLQGVKRIAPETEVIVMTAHGTLESGVAAIKAGALDFLLKPIKPEEMMLVVDQALEHRRRSDRLSRLEQAAEADVHVGESKAFHRLADQVTKVAPTDATVLLTGESGVGKEVVARWIHGLSKRAKAPRLAVNLGAITETLQESELFGHVKGSFTGATSSRKGIFLEADGGTLFLDEIGEASASTQVKLLRVLAEGHVRPVGGDRDVRVDTRVVVATNADLREASTEGRFREDLYFRINVFPVHVPALRERAEDIPGLARHLVVRHCRKLGRPPCELADDAIARLEAYTWPGNVRELENVLERTLILQPGPVIGADDVPLSAAATDGLPVAQDGGRIRPLDEVQREHVLRVLALCGGQKQRAAEALGIARATLFRKLKEYGVR